MAELIIRLQIDPETGKRNVIVKLESDPDSLPQEHEALHRQLVNKLIDGGMLKAEDLGHIIIEREPSQQQSTGPVSAPQQEERRSESAGN